MEFSDVFAFDDTELGCTQLVEHTTDTGDHAPICQQPYPTPVVKCQQMDEMISAMQEQRIIETSWAKRDGSLRFCIDY